MSSWMFSWLPSLPSINVPLPSSIQRRFISFLLKKSLGHLLKPGQLEIQQIDSQIGSGYVQVSNLELDSEAVNALLTGLPVELVEGTISSATVRIPWPNPLTSTMGLSISSVHLTLRILPPTEHPAPVAPPDLSESVASMAESFIADELTPRDQATLLQSIHGDLPDVDQAVPGGLDPFLNASPDEDGLGENDPSGVSVFATMIESLLARFKFDAVDTKITLLHANHAAWTISVQEMAYNTSIKEPLQQGSGMDARPISVRSLAVSGLSVAFRNLGAPSPIHSMFSSENINLNTSTSTSPQAESPSPSSPASESSSSSMDEATNLAMSQSLFLPARPGSPSSSVASSMYQSAISEAGEDASGHFPSRSNTPVAKASPTPEERPDTPPSLSVKTSPPADEVVLSISQDPVTIQLEMPSNRGERITVSLSVGIIALGIRALHIRRLLDLFAMISSPASASPSHSSPNSTAPFTSAQASVRVRGLAALILPSNLTSSLTEFYDHPLVPPSLNVGYTRLFFDHINASTAVQMFPVFEMTGSASLKDLSAFVHYSDGHSAFPLLITDPLLSAQYSVRQTLDAQATSGPFPTFDVLDWRDRRLHGQGGRVSLWRAKTARRGDVASLEHGTEPRDVITVALGQTGGGSELSVDIAPLHVFVDLSDILGQGHLKAFLDELTTSEVPSTLAASSPISMDEEPWDQGEIERQRIEQEEIDSLGLGLDYRRKVEGSSIPVNKRRSGRTNKESRTATRISAKITMLRLELRCPCPHHKAPRSGSLVLDVHDLLISPTPPTPGVRFSESPPIGSWAALVVAYSLVGQSKASVLCVVGPTGKASHNDINSVDDRPSLGMPSVTNMSGMVVRKTLALTVELPSLQVILEKDTLDGLQYWADDASQLLESTSAGSDTATEKGGSADASMIGSNYFARSRADSSSASTVTGVPSSTSRSETIVKIAISEASVRLVVNRNDRVKQPFDIRVANIDVLLELKPEGKEETVITVGVMDCLVRNTNSQGVSQDFLSLTIPRGTAQSTKTLLKAHITSLVVPETGSKESRIKVSLWGITYTVYPDLDWSKELAAFFKAPPGVFESVVPTERTTISLKILDVSLRLLGPSHPGCLVAHIGDLAFSTVLTGNSPKTSFKVSVPALTLLAADEQLPELPSVPVSGVLHWKKLGLASLAEVQSLDLKFVKRGDGHRNSQHVTIDTLDLRLHLCADTMTSVSALIGDVQSAFSPKKELNSKPVSKANPVVLSEQQAHFPQIFASIDDAAFKKIPTMGSAADMIDDDLPTNLEYLDDSYSASAGLREFDDEDLDDIGPVDSKETIKILRPEGLNVIEHHFDTLPPDTTTSSKLGDTSLEVRLYNTNVNVFLYDGYDWPKTRRTIEEQVKEMRKRLTKIRQLVADGQTQDIGTEQPGATLFNSVYIGLEQDLDEMEPDALIAAIDAELNDDDETGSQSSWQSLPPPPAIPSGGVHAPRVKSTRVHGKRLTRAKGPSIEFKLAGLELEFDQYLPNQSMVSRTFATVKDLEILDHIKTSTWSKFLTDLHSDSRGNIRETDSNMVRFELTSLRTVPNHPSEEARLKAKILPLRLHVDQDALDFLKKFFSFKDPFAAEAEETEKTGEMYFQSAEVFPVDLKLDYKPRRVDYRALREGKTIELMNFFHFDGAEMTLRHITLHGITGWATLGDMLNDLWTPDVKATQLVEVISGVAPIRSVVNVGSGIADLVLLPIAQYKKDGRIVRGVQKGATAFVKSTATEAIKMGARLAIGTQVILEQAEGVLGGQQQFKDGNITAETMALAQEFLTEDEEGRDLISKYAEQPDNVQEGVQFAYKSLRKNLNSAAQTILAVPMEVYERSGNEGAVRSVIRAVPIAVLKPMIGASEAVSKTLLGLHNTLDPNVRHENEAKYKHR